MANSGERGFRVVRRGYDIDEVDAFLVTQARAWGEALEESKQQVAALENEVARLRQAEAEVERLERDLADRTETAEVTAAQVRDEAKREAAEIVQAARTEASELTQEAELARRAREQAEVQKYESMQAELDVRYEDSRERYAKAEAILHAKVEDLDATRQSLVAGLEAIARGGLGGLNPEATKALSAIGLVDAPESSDSGAVAEGDESTADESGAEPIPAPPTAPEAHSGNGDGAHESGSAQANGSTDHSDGGAEDADQPAVELSTETGDAAETGNITQPAAEAS